MQLTSTMLRTTSPGMAVPDSSTSHGHSRSRTLVMGPTPLVCDFVIDSHPMVDIALRYDPLDPQSDMGRIPMSRNNSGRSLTSKNRILASPVDSPNPLLVVTTA